MSRRIGAGVTRSEPGVGRRDASESRGSRLSSPVGMQPRAFLGGAATTDSRLVWLVGRPS